MECIELNWLCQECLREYIVETYEKGEKHPNIYFQYCCTELGKTQFLSL